MLFDFIPVTDSRGLLVTSRTTVPNPRGFLVGLTVSVPAEINLANSTSRNSVGHLLVRLAGASNAVCVHHNRSVNLERTDCQSSVSNG